MEEKYCWFCTHMYFQVKKDGEPNTLLCANGYWDAFEEEHWPMREYLRDCLVSAQNCPDFEKE